MLCGASLPAQQYLDALKKGKNTEGNSDVVTALAAMQAQQQQVMALVLCIASGQKVELLEGGTRGPRITRTAEVEGALCTLPLRLPGVSAAQPFSTKPEGRHSL